MNKFWTIIPALLLYDWILSFDREVKFIWNWQSRFTVPSLLYVLIRYVSIINNLLPIATMFPMSNQVGNISAYLFIAHSLCWCYRGIGFHLPQGTLSSGYWSVPMLLASNQLYSKFMGSGCGRDTSNNFNQQRVSPFQSPGICPIHSCIF